MKFCSAVPAVLAVMLVMLMVGCGGGGGGDPLAPPDGSIDTQAKPPAEPSMTVGSKGGRITTPDGLVSLYFWPGSLKKPLTVTVVAAVSPPPHPYLVPGTAWDIGPTSATLPTSTAAPFLSLYYNPANLPAGVPENTLYIAQVVNGAWQRLLGENIVHADEDYVEARITSFGTFAVIGEGGFGDLSGAISWGGAGTGPGQFSSPRGAAPDPSGTCCYVADTLNDRVQKFSAAGAYICQWGGSGTGAGQFSRPADVAVDPTGQYVYVADALNSRVQKFTADGQYVAQWGGYGTANGQFDRPYGLGLDAVGNVYVTDYDLNRVQKFSADGQWLMSFGASGSGPGQFAAMVDVAVDAAGLIYVTDSGNSRVQRFDPTGVYLGQWGGAPGAADGQFYSPYGIALDGAGNAYVSDQSLHRLQQLDAGGSLVAKWNFGSPRCPGVDTAGGLYVPDYETNLVWHIPQS